MSRKKRSLDPEEKELWEKVRVKVTPLHPHAINKAIKETKEQTNGAQAAVSKKGSKPAAMIAPAAQRPQQPKHKPSIKMDSKTHGKMTRGKLKPEARIDLHGMTSDQAHSALLSFILKSHADGRRLVLVITGKGRNTRDDFGFSGGEGVLRRMVPHWLLSGTLAPHVLQVDEAHFRHGGAGALYVYLRRGK